MNITKLLPVIIILLICIIVFTDIYENFVGCYSIHTGKKITEDTTCESNHCYCFNGIESHHSMCSGASIEHCNSCNQGYIQIDNRCLLQPQINYSYIQDIDCNTGYYKSEEFCEPCKRCEDFGEVQISDCTSTTDTECVEYFTPVYVCGHSLFSRFGIGNTDEPMGHNNFNLQNVLINKNIIDIGLSKAGSMFLTNIGEVYTCGEWTKCCNPRQRGRNYITTPEKITYFDTENVRITQISKTNLYTLFLTNTGRVYYCGTNRYGANGKADRQIANTQTPYLLDFSTTNINIEYIATNSANASVIIADGVVYYSGSNIMNYKSSSQWGYVYSFTPITFFSQQGINIRKVYTLAPITMFITYSGQVYAYGKGTELGLGTNYVTNDEPEILPFSQEHPIKEIAMGYDHTLFLTETGKVWGCGNWQDGQLGLGFVYAQQHQPKATPVQLNFFNNFTIIKIAAGKYHSLFLTDTGIVYGCGQNDKGQLGITNTQLRQGYYVHYEPVEITNNISNIFTDYSTYSMFIGNIIA